ncbi:glycosyltransferase family 2 protein [Thiorhodococcus mannitoliphagus]|uniref:Glycosyltransferase family 2 protein n=2 Tax=Thiorhodococcus mannitoliphagus TaxID=329406 RepID=A0A6P1E0K0_9GAMM|nr:glycosyltransferase family 2 protein [Thiorhodococcus mannitoliphagus]
MKDLITEPLVSIVMVNWNYQQFVTQAIDSVKHQTYTRWECVVVDNGSSDQSIEVIARAIEGDNRFRLLRLENNIGHFAGAMAALKHITGCLVAFLDADDYYFPQFLSSHVQVHISAIKPTAFTSSNTVMVDSDNTLISGGLQQFDAKDERFRKNLPKHPLLLASGVTPEYYDRLRNGTYFGGEDLGYWYWQHGSSNVLRRELLDILKPTTEGEIPFGGVDTYFLIPLSAITGATVMDVSLSAYRLHETNDWGRMPLFNGILAGNLDAYARNKLLKRLLITTLIEKAEILSATINPSYRYFRFLEIVFHHSGETVLLGRESPFSSDPIIDTLSKKMPFFVETFGMGSVFQEFRKMMPHETLCRVISRTYEGRKRWRVLFSVWKKEYISRLKAAGRRILFFRR